MQRMDAIVLNPHRKPPPPQCLLPESLWEEVAQRFKLSPREGDVVRGIMEGECEPSIARTLGISAHTVHTHVTRAYRKLAVHSRAELALRIASAFVRLGNGQRAASPIIPMFERSGT